MIRAVDRAFDILDCFKTATELNLSELSERTGLSKSTTHRFLTVLEERGAVVRDPKTQRFAIGPAIIALSARQNGPEELQRLAQPIMAELRDASGETVVLSLRVGDHRIAVDQCESHQQLRRSVQVGEVRPLYLGGAGKAMLAYSDMVERERVLQSMPRERITSYTITDPDLLAAELDRIRKRGYAVAENEYLFGVISIAAPVFGSAGRAIAALTLTGPVFRITPEMVQRLGPVVAEAAGKLTRLIAPDAKGAPVPAPAEREQRRSA
ncbi:IclR family transcriptional regulator [Azospirillum himalayense]|uniref:IclR family transcriptional regulator n=1 Tax=Azospirillum himalayense TaxID=654847 RepID=A0ABW0GAP6_9PROT